MLRAPRPLRSPLRSETPGRPLHHNSTITQLNIATLGSTPAFRRTQGMGAVASQGFWSATNCRGDGFAPKPPAPAFSAPLRNAGETSSSQFNNRTAQHRHPLVHPGVPKDAGDGGFDIPQILECHKLPGRRLLLRSPRPLRSPLRSETPGRPLDHNSTIAQLNIATHWSTPAFRRTQGTGALDIPDSPVRSETPGRPLHHNSTIAQLEHRRTRVHPGVPKDAGDGAVASHRLHSSTSPPTGPPRRSEGRRGWGL